MPVSLEPSEGDMVSLEEQTGLDKGREGREGERALAARVIPSVARGSNSRGGRECLILPTRSREVLLKINVRHFRSLL